MSRTRIVLIVGLLVLVVGCGDNDNSENDNNDNESPVPTPTVTTSATNPGPTATAHPEIPCPEQVTYTVMEEGSDLDVGWTGIYHNQPLGSGGALSFSVDCAGTFLGACGDCAISGPIASTTVVNNQRCQDDTSVTCTSAADCGSGACAFFFGAPLAVSGGGVPVCVTNRVDGPVTGTIHPEVGDGTSNIAIVFTNFTGLSEDRPCPTCSGASLGASGTCQGGARDGAPCATHEIGTIFGNTSFDCPPNPSADIGSSNLQLNLTTGTRELAPSTTCAGPAGGTCYCAGQLQPNQCTDQVCTVDAGGQGTCNGGPVDTLCAVESFRSCTTNAECPAAGDSCVSQNRSCIGPTDASGMVNGSIIRTGQPSQTVPLQVATFCIDETRSAAVNTTAGFPGPGGLLLPTAACIKTSCP
jgi:hypothetical protein